MEITQDSLDKMNDNSLYNTIGIRVEEAEKGQARSFLLPPSEVCWPFPGQPHGGILFTFMDTTMAWAVISLLDEGLSCSTVNLDIEYTHPAKGKQFSCRAWVLDRTGRSCFVRADIHDADGQLIAIGQGNFRIIKFSFDYLLG